MQVGKVIFILTDKQTDELLSIVKGAASEELQNTLEQSRKTIFIDDIRKDLVSEVF